MTAPPGGAEPEALSPGRPCLSCGLAAAAAARCSGRGGVWGRCPISAVSSARERLMARQSGKLGRRYWKAWPLSGSPEELRGRALAGFGWKWHFLMHLCSSPVVGLALEREMGAGTGAR